MTSADFAAAQARVLDRRAVRDTEAASQRVAQQESFRASPLSRLPFPLDHTSRSLHALWSTLSDREGTRPEFRVGQVDAELLDEELLELLKGQVGEALKYYGPHIWDEWSREILLALRAALFRLSIWDHDASYGAALQNLRYTDARDRSNTAARPTKWQKGVYGLLTVLGRYGWDKWESWLIDQEGGYTTPSGGVQLLSRVTSWINTSHSIAAFISFLVFLVNGRYRTLTDRLLRLRLAPPSSQYSREVSFEYLNRQLIWHAFTEFLLFFLPLVGISRWRRWLSRAWRKAKSALKSSTQDQGEDVEFEKSGQLAFLPERTCAICYQDQNPTASSEADILGANAAAGGGGVIGSATTDVVNPYETLPCGCIYCFVCIATKLDAEEGEGWACLRCGDIVNRCRPWSGDVLLEQRMETLEEKHLESAEDNNDRENEELKMVEPMPEDDVEQFHGESSQWSTVGREISTESLSDGSDFDGKR